MYTASDMLTSQRALTAEVEAIDAVVSKEGRDAAAQRDSLLSQLWELEDKHAAQARLLLSVFA